MVFNAAEFTFKGDTSDLTSEQKFWFQVTASDGLATAVDEFYMDMIFEVPVEDTTVASL